MRTLVRIGTGALVLLALAMGDAAQPGAAVPHMAYSQGVEAQPGDDAVELAKGHLRTNASRLHLKPDLSDLKHTTTRTSLAGQHVEFQQLAGAYPVWNGTVTVHLDKARKAEPKVNSRYKAGAGAPLAAAGVSRESALQKGSDHVAPGAKLSRRATGDLVVYPDKDGGFRLAWAVKLSSEKPLGDWEVLVDAATGNVLASFNHVRKDSWR